MDAKLAGILKLSTQKKSNSFNFFVAPFLSGNLENLELLIFLDKKPFYFGSETFDQNNF